MMYKGVYIGRATNGLYVGFVVNKGYVMADTKEGIKAMIRERLNSL